MIVKKIKKINEKLREIFPVKDSYLNIWEELAEKLPIGMSASDIDKRKKLWRAFDYNNNNLLSFTEAEMGIKDVVKLPMIFKIKPVIKMAFNTTKHGLKTNDIYLKDYLEKHQFRHFLKFIRQYYEYWVAFESIDLNGDR